MTDLNNLVPISSIPLFSADEFHSKVCSLLRKDGMRCLSYFAVPKNAGFLLICVVADDETHGIDLSGVELRSKGLPSIAAEHYALHAFEREMHENYGLEFYGHPWLKPLRYSADRFDRTQSMENYPFYSISGDDLHEVGVGPIHAGIIEPGHFRFICDGETVLHLEIMLGYQHRGIERLMLETQSELRRTVLAESIAGDTAVGHATAHVAAIESLAGHEPSQRLQIERAVALELERIAMHVGDTSALCLDVAYQLGQVACEALRTIIINTMQAWCGSRFGNGLVRPAGTKYPLDETTTNLIRKNIDEVYERYKQISDCFFNLPSVLARFEGIGTVTTEQARLVGLVGPAARSAGLARDVRKTLPAGYYRNIEHEILVHDTGDVLARLRQRVVEVKQSVQLIRTLLDAHERTENRHVAHEYDLRLEPDSLCISTVEGWRGEICHVLITDGNGRISFCKLKDPSFHNWTGLALAVRNQQISDFPICNKSFNLSYCGHDL